MLATHKIYRCIPWNNHMTAVIEGDVRQPQKMEIIAFFFSLLRAEEYLTALTNEKTAAFVPDEPELEEEKDTATVSFPHLREEPEIVEEIETPGKMTFELNDQQKLIMEVLRQNMNERNEVTISQGTIAQKTGIAPGSVYYALRKLISQNALVLRKSGSVKEAAVYRIHTELAHPAN